MATSTASPLYLKLIRVFPLRPIRTEEDHDRAIAVVDSLVTRMDRLTPDERDYLDILGSLIERYESEIYPEPDLPPHEMLRELIRARGITQADVARDRNQGVGLFGGPQRKTDDGAKDDRGAVAVLLRRSRRPLSRCQAPTD
jgi:HTH-type transcriptional regulator / antitoxin HigA